MDLSTLLRSWLLRWKAWLIGAGALLLLYAALGFLVLPAVVKAKLPPRLGALLGREVRLQTVRSNPFTLSITLEGFEVVDRDGGALLAWERLYVNLQASSLFTRTVDFKAIELSKPRGRVVVAKDGKLNFSDILERLKRPGAAPEPAAKPREVAIGHLLISGASLALADHSPAEPFSTTIGPLTLELNGFRTHYDSRNPYAFEGRTESGERFAWQGSFSVEPLRSEGTLAVEQVLLPKYHPYLRDQVDFDIREGRASARAAYLFEWAEGRHALKLKDGSLDLQGLKIGAAAGPARIAAASIQARGLQADLLGSKVELASLAVTDLRADLVREADGSLDLVKLLTPRPRPKTEPTQPFALRLGELALRQVRLGFEDRTTPRLVKAELDQAALTLRGFDLGPRTFSELDFEGRMNGRARIKAEGKVALLVPSIDLAVKVENLDLPAFDPYLEPALDVRVSRGSLGLDGRIRGTFAGRPSDSLAFVGRVRLANFEAMDGVLQEVFLRYRLLSLEGMELRTDPRILKIRAVDLLEPENRLVIAQDGSSNVARALKLELPAGSGAAAAAVPPTPKAPEGRPFAVDIAGVALKGGRLAFIDRSLEPNAALLLTDLQGHYSGLTSEAGAQSAVDIQGRAGGLAPVRIQGRAMPLRHDQDTDLSLKIQGAELSDFGPYAGKYLGYTIRKGKLEVDARLRIQQRRLQVDDKVRLDQFFLGDKVDSPDATKLPVKLALALLRDRKGVMDLELPIDGSLDDPDFHYGKIVWKAIVNVLGKLAASPFTLLGKLFGGGDQDLSAVAFAPGSAGPDPAALRTVAVLAKALAERPDLNLEVEGCADPGADGAAIKKEGLERLLRRAKATALRDRQPELEEAALTIQPGERETWIRAAFAAAFPAPAPQQGKEPPPSPPPAEMEQRLLAGIPVAGGDLRQLADARTKALVAALVADGRVPAGRVFATEGGERARKEGGCRAYFTLK